MSKFLLSMTAVSAIVGSTMSLAVAVPMRAPLAADAAASDVANVGYVCGPGAHLGPNLRCRPNGALPVFSFRKPCAPGFHRSFGLCRRNRL